MVAAGGDGTVSAVASALVGGRVPLGVLPLGTLNHFAQDNGIPLDPKEAAKIIIAFNVTDNAILDLEKCTKKLVIFPDGHILTKTIPIATLIGG